MPTIDEVRDLLQNISAKLATMEDTLRIDGSRQIVIHEGLSDISESLGTISAGEFRAGKGIPGKGFTGVRMAYPSLSYGDSSYVLVGIDNDSLQFGLDVDDGTGVFGGGTHKLSSTGYILQASSQDRPEIIVQAGNGEAKSRIGGYALSSDRAGFYLMGGMRYDGTYWQQDALPTGDTDSAASVFSLHSSRVAIAMLRHTAFDAGSDIPSSDLIISWEVVSSTDGIEVFRPGWESLGSLGDAVSYWQDVSYKTLTDRGCLGWYDDGVLVRGKRVSDIESLKAIKPHPTKKTPAGRARLDYATLPDDVYRPAKVADKDIYREPDEMNRRKKLMYRKGEKMGEDGAEMTALFSIMIGAIKELDARMEKLEARL